MMRRPPGSPLSPPTTPFRSPRPAFPAQDPRQPLGVARVGQPLVVPPGGMSRIPPALLDERGQGGGPLAGAPRLAVHARGDDGDPPRVHAPELTEDTGHVVGPGQDDSRRYE